MSAVSGREFTTVGVVGLGTMGAGIVEVFARNGLKVIGVEHTEHALEHGREHVRGSTGRAVARGKLSTEDQQALLERITFTTNVLDLADVDLVVEAIPERIELKRTVFETLDKVCRPEAVLATNTSSLSVTDISVATTRPNRVVGMHFFNPAPVLKLVEVVQTVVTEQAVVDDVVSFAQRLGKIPVVIGDKAGFIANALLFGYLNHAVAMYESRYATREDIDAAMKLGCGLPMGPLALLDLIGLDTAYEILDTMYKQGRDRLHAPTPLIKQMVAAGFRGRKSGRGFYTYDAPDSPVVVADGPGAGGRVAPARDEPALARPVTRIGVVGSGLMATGITEVLAKSGYDVTYIARGEAKVTRAREAIERSLDKGVLRGKVTEAERGEALARIVGSDRLDDLADVDLVIEAVVEELSVKQALFAVFDEVCKPGAVLTSTTSSLPVIELATATARPQDVVGMHWCNPAPVMGLVEVVATVASAPEAIETVKAVAVHAGKHAVECGDRAGFIVNALLFPYLNDAIKMLEAHYATAEDIDSAMKVGCGYPMGPFELLDVVGLDVALSIERTLYLEFRDRGYAPAPLLEQLVTAGYLGRKTGRGFRDYARR
jgi:3-hydroxybutyryl-CoA dehydrogenase